MLVKSQSIYLKFNTQTLINNRRFCPGKNISTQEQTSCEMLLCVFRSLEEVKSSNHVHITVVHNVPARKNYIFDVLFCITMSFGFEEYFICQMGTTLGLEQLVWLEPLQAWRIFHWYSIHFANRLKENLQNTFWTKPSHVTTVKTEIFSIILYFVWKRFWSALVWWFQRFKIM